MAPRIKKASPENSMSQVPPPNTITSEERVPPPLHTFTMGPPFYTASHNGPSAATLSASEKRPISTSSYAEVSTTTLPAPSERPVNISKEQDITQMPQATSALDKEQRRHNISIYNQDLRKVQLWIQQKQKEIDKLQVELDKTKGDNGMIEKLLKGENQLKQKEEECDYLVAVVQIYTDDYERRKIPRPSLTPLLQGRKRSYADGSQELEERNTRSRTDTAEN